MDRQDGQDFLLALDSGWRGDYGCGRDGRQEMDSVAGWWMTPVAGGIIMAVK